MQYKNFFLFPALVVAVSAAWLLGFSSASANLLTDGDFQDAGNPLNSAPNPFTISGQLNEWYNLNNNYTKTSGGPAGAADIYARHTTAANGSDFRLVQFVSGAGLGAGDNLTLEFDYIYEQSPNAQANPAARVSLIGITADRQYSMFGGAGLDGIFNAAGDFAVAPPDDLLAIDTLAFTPNWATNQLLSAVLSKSYFAVGVVFTSGCFNAVPNQNCGQLRGLDNASLTAVPEPATIGLLGTGLIGLGFAVRRRRKMIR